jgi:Domain of unknown function (DUF4412)
MMKSTWAVMGLAAAALVASGCKPKASVEANPAASAAVAVSPPAPKPAVTVATTPMLPAFEGEIQLALYQPNSKTPETIAYDVKGDKIRSQPVGGDATAAHVVGDRKDKRAYAVVDSNKSYATVDMDPKTPLPAVTKTGKVEHLVGRDCEDWTISDGGERFDMCVAKGIAYLDPAAGAGEPSWAAVLTRERAFPLRVIATDKVGKQEFRAEATKIEQKHLDDALFKVPNDYHVVPMTKSMKVASIP